MPSLEEMVAATTAAVVTVEMQREIVSFGFAGGAGFPITDATNVQP